MNLMFYPKLAAGNIRKNRGIYIPFIAASSVTFAMYYIICSLSRNEGLLNLSFGAAAVTSVLNFGSYVVAVFAVIFLFYTNSFLIKRRRKEFAIYNILGMEKKHLSIVMTFEMLFALLLIFLTGQSRLSCSEAAAAAKKSRKPTGLSPCSDLSALYRDMRLHWPLKTRFRR